MILLDLNPRWWCFEAGDQRVGLTFECPHCRETRIGVAFHHRGHEAMDDQYIRAHGNADHIWTIESGKDFHDLTLSPSVDASKLGHWHGFIRGGRIE